MAEQKTLWLADHHLCDERGHHANYNRALGLAARQAGWEPRVLGRRGTDPRLLDGISMDGIFQRDWRARPPSWVASSPLALKALDAFSRVRFAKDLARGLAGVRENDAVFAQMLAPRHLLGWLEWHRTRPRKPHLVLHLGYDPTRFAAYPGLLAALGAADTRCHFVSDSERLCSRYNEALGVEVGVIPHVVPKATPKPSASRADGPPVVLFLGNPRREKGFNDLVAAALRASGLKFVFQVNDPEPACGESVAKLRQAAGETLHLLERRLSESEYFEALREADVVAVPYHLDIYGDRTSGIFCEALAAGKPVITTRGSWMSANMDGCGWQVAERDPEDLLQVLQRIPGELESVSRRTVEMAEVFRRQFGGENFMALFEAILAHA